MHKIMSYTLLLLSAYFMGVLLHDTVASVAVLIIMMWLSAITYFLCNKTEFSLIAVILAIGVCMELNLILSHTFIIVLCMACIWVSGKIMFHVKH